MFTKTLTVQSPVEASSQILVKDNLQVTFKIYAASRSAPTAGT